MSSNDSARLQQIFEKFATFGSGSQLALSTPQLELDNVKFAKLCRDTKIVGKNVTTTDVDIIYKKVLRLGERKINFEQFKTALRLLSEKKFPNETLPYERIVVMVCKANPSTNSTTDLRVGGIYSKLTDTSLYTGTHKQRFDENGKGRGIAGRDTPLKTADLSQIVARTSGTTKRTVSRSMEQLSEQAIRPRLQSNGKKLSAKTSRK